ncbi:hypothetical protein FRC08_010803 [Ceratobasidium sp. 394]|nr:hypothetical protein FRC08_010803 [Ceratobasidium sp. 394]
MSEDTLGEELAPDATIWKLYVEEATEQDQELANLQNKNLDLMLLFAALFSAILAAFLVEAKKMLEEDPAAKSAALLLLVAQSQQRLELGTPDASLKLAESVPFAPTSSARYVNGLWFTALALSLAAALVAMLAKEWLAAFVSSTVRPSYDHALQRQAKYNGLSSWRALYIIALLPSLLHLSLLLFALGLVVYLWSLDKAIALVIGAVAGVTLFLYVVTAILGAIFESCPFVTYVSTYIRGAYLAILGDRGLFENRLSSAKLFHHTGVPNEALQALGWLAANSRDPAVANCAYQALAAHTGLSQSPICSVTESDPTVPSNKFSSTNQTSSRQVFNNSEMSTNSKFLHAICKQFTDTIMHRHREVAACFGTNLARYAVALPTLATYIETFRELEHPGRKPRSENDWRTGQNSFELAFSTIDSVWNNDCVPLSADTYAILTSAELRLAASIASFDAPNLYHANKHITSSKPLEAHHQLINFASFGYGGLKISVSPARYCRTLARASVLLHYHHTSQAPIGTIALVHLLRSISSVVRCERVIFSSDLEVKVNVVGGATERCPNVDMLGDPNGIFSRLLKIWDMEVMPGTWSRLEDAASQAVSSFAHHFLKEWIGRNEIQGPQTKSRSSSYRGIDFELSITSQEALDKESFDRALENWPEDQNLSKARGPLPAVLSRLLVISAISVYQAERLAVPSGFPTLVLRALYRSAEALSGQPQLYAVISENSRLVKRLLQLVEDNADMLESSDPHSSSFAYLTRFFALSFEKRTLMSYCGLHPQEMVTLLKTIKRAPNHPVEVELLLYDVVQLLQDRPGTYIPLFAEENTAMLTLLDIGRHDEHVPAVSNTLQLILQFLVNGSSEEQPIRCNISGAGGLLAALNFLAHASSGPEALYSEDFITNAVEFLQCSVERASWSELGRYLLEADPEGGGIDQRIVDALGRFSSERCWSEAGLPRTSNLDQRWPIDDTQ